MTFNLERLTKLYKSKSLTQADLAEKVGISRQALSNIMNRRADPQLSTAVKIANTLEVPVSYLVGELNYTFENLNNIEKRLKEAEQTVDELRFIISVVNKSYEKK